MALRTFGSLLAGGLADRPRLMALRTFGSLLAGGLADRPRLMALRHRDEIEVGEAMRE